MIKKLVAFDFDGTLIDSPEKESGKVEWSEKTGQQYPHIGWWGRPESLNLDIFDIKPFSNVLNILKKEVANPESYVIILTSRMEKLRPQIEAVLNKNHIHVDKIDMKRAESDKGKKILRYIEQFPDLQEIDVYDDRDSDIVSYKQISSIIPKNIEFKIFVANQGQLRLMEIVREEIQKFIEK